MKYNIDKINKAIESVSQMIEQQYKLRSKYYQLKYSLLRQSRALKDTFWLDELLSKTYQTVQERTQAKKKIFEDELNLMRNSYPNSNYSQYNTIHDRMMSKQSVFYFHKRMQWEHDRQQILKEMNTVKA